MPKTQGFRIIQVLLTHFGQFPQDILFKKIKFLFLLKLKYEKTQTIFFFL